MELIGLAFELGGLQGYVTTGEPLLVLLVGSHEPIPEPEDAKIATVVTVMPIVTVSAKHDGREKSPGGQGELVAGVSVQSLPHANDHPDDASEQVRTHKEATCEGGDGIGEQRFNRVGELGGPRDRGCEAMMLCVDVLVQPGVRVQRSVRPIEEEIVNQREHYTVEEYAANRGQGTADWHLQRL